MESALPKPIEIPEIRIEMVTTIIAIFIPTNSIDLPLSKQGEYIKS